jgi:ubiquitin-protein ligase
MRTHTTTCKVATPFGGAFVHTEVDSNGLICGGAISHKWKEPDAQVSQLIEAISDGFDDTLAASGGRIIWWRRLLRQWRGR